MWKLPYLLMNCSFVRGSSPRHENVGLSWRALKPRRDAWSKIRPDVTQLRGFSARSSEWWLQGRTFGLKARHHFKSALNRPELYFQSIAIMQMMLQSSPFRCLSYEMWNKAMYVRLNSLRTTIMLPIRGQDIKRRWWQQWLRFNGSYVETNSK